MSVFLRVSYTVRVHHMEVFEKTLLGEVVPLARDLGIRYAGAWKTLVGRVGEYMELWEFDSVADFERRWFRLLEHPRIQEIFRTSGAMVEGEKFELIQPLDVPDSTRPDAFRV